MLIPNKKSEIMNNLRTITMVSMETKFASQDSILDKLSEKIYFSRFWEGAQGFYCAPKKLALDKGKDTQKRNFHHRLVVPHNEACNKPDADPPFLLAVTAPDLTADLRLRNDLWRS